MWGTKLYIQVNETEKDFTVLLDNTLRAVTENISVYHIFITAAVQGMDKGNNVQMWTTLALKICESSYKLIKDKTLITDEFVLMLAFKLAKHFKNELDNQLNHQQ